MKKAVTVSRRHFCQKGGWKMFWSHRRSDGWVSDGAYMYEHALEVFNSYWKTQPYLQLHRRFTDPIYAHILEIWDERCARQSKCFYRNYVFFMPFFVLFVAIFLSLKRNYISKYTVFIIWKMMCVQVWMGKNIRIISVFVIFKLYFFSHVYLAASLSSLWNID